MDIDTTPKFHLLNRFPREIRDKIFKYMVESNIDFYRQPSRHKFPFGRRPFGRRNTLGLEPSHAACIFLVSPWTIYNKQYCAEYLAVFVRQLVLEVDIGGLWAGAEFISVSGDYQPMVERSGFRPWATGVRALEYTLDEINKQFESANHPSGIGSTDKALLWHLKGIIFSLHYPTPFFEVGFGQPDQRFFPPAHYLRRPLTKLRECHEKYHVQSSRLSIHISYGHPTSAIMACHEVLNRDEPHPLDPMDFYSLDPLKVQIYPTDYAASVAAIDKEIEIMRQAVERVIRSLRTDYVQPHHLVDIMQLENMINSDMASLRRHHLKGIEEATEFWRMQDGMYELSDMFKVVEAWGSEQ